MGERKMIDIEVEAWAMDPALMTNEQLIRAWELVDASVEAGRAEYYRSRGKIADVAPDFDIHKLEGDFLQLDLIHDEAKRRLGIMDGLTREDLPSEGGE